MLLLKGPPEVSPLRAPHPRTGLIGDCGVEAGTVARDTEERNWLERPETWM